MRVLLVVLVLMVCSYKLDGGEKIIKMGYRTTEKLPYIHEDPDNSGYFKDVYEEAARRIGYKLEIVRLPKLRVLQDLEAGKLDFYPGFSFDSTRAQYSVWMSLGRVQRDVAISLSSLKDLNTEKDLQGLTQLVALGNPDYLSHFDKSKFDQHPVAELNVERALQILELKRADFYIYEEDALKYYLKVNNLKGFKLHTKLLKDLDYESAGFSKNSPLFKEELNEKYIAQKPLALNNLPGKVKKGCPAYLFQEALKSMVKDGYIMKMYKKHFE